MKEKIPQRFLDPSDKTYSNSFTSAAEDWQLYHSIEDLDGTTARKIETHIKSMKSKKYLENLKTIP